MATYSSVYEGFSVSHVGILDGHTLFEDAADTMGDIYGVQSANLEPDMGDADNVGDDAILSSWRWFNKATLTVTAGYLSFDVLATITGDVIGSSGSGVSTSYSFDLWAESQMNVSPVPVLLVIPSKDSEGNVRNLLIGCYKAQFGPVQIQGPAYKEGLKISYVATVLTTEKDELGRALDKKKVGRFIGVAP